MSREVRWGLLAVAGLGAFVFAMLLVGSMGTPRQEVTFVAVDDVLAGGSPADRYGGTEMRIAGWYAELAGDCVETDPRPAYRVPWLERECPLRVLLPYQPPRTVTQQRLLADGLRLSAPTGQPFPARAQPGGPNLRLQQLVYLGHFADPAAGECAADLRDRCRNTFVVTDYDGLMR
ncbi:MAG TPA: hypothetical protein VF013_03080 [Candidatus Limnocylindria bacterium]